LTFIIFGDIILFGYTANEKGAAVEPQFFVPQVGRLITRCHVSGSGSRHEICFRDNEGDQAHYLCIAEISGFFARPKIYGFVEMTHEEAYAQQMADSHVIHRHFSTFEELGAIKRLWDDRNKVQFYSWLEEVLELNSLATQEKERLKLTRK
jgi:hypothetical protein